MNIIFIFLTAFILTAIITPFVIKFAKKSGMVDDPSKREHPAHTQMRIIPRAGGLAIFLGITITSLIFLPLDKYLIGIFLGISILLLTGILDDKIKNFSPYIRLALLFLAAGMAVGAGIGVSFITNPLSLIPNLPPEISVSIIRLDNIVFTVNFWGIHNILLIADILAFLWIVTLTQIINWSKGVDGQMPGITLVAAIVLGLLSLKFYSQGDINQLEVAKLAFITAGVSLGFLIFNWYPSKILPGFSGSTILAFMLATLAILSGAKIATAILVLAIPTIDFFYTFIRRVVSGKSPVWGDRGHLHHKLLDIGWSHPKITLFYMLVSVILGAVALTADPSGKIFITLIVIVLVIGLILWLNSFGDLSRPRGRVNG
jgi:UDP-GlcNAc:undecaprenyl-phosphate GlcNAc-1-phosphate transferase